MKKKWIEALAVSAVAGASVACGAPFVQVFQHSAFPPTSGNLLETTSYGPGNPITINPREATRFIMVLPQGGSLAYSQDVDIGRITFPESGFGDFSQTPREVKVAVGGKFITTGLNGGTIPDPTVERWGRFWNGIQEPPWLNNSEQQFVTINLYAAVGNTLKDSVIVDKLTRLDIGTELSANVTVTHGIEFVTHVWARQMYDSASNSPTVWIKNGPIEKFTLVGDDMSDDGASSTDEDAAMAGIIQIDDGNLVVLETGSTTPGSPTVYNNGTIRGPVYVTDGNIGTITVENGAIVGPAAAPTSNPNYRIIAREGIGSIIADAIDCDIRTNQTTTTLGAGEGYIGRFETRSGDFEGCLTTRGVGIPSGGGVYQVDIANDLVGKLDVAESVLSVTGLPAITIGGELAETSKIVIGEYLKGDSSNGGIVFGNDGLLGQVVINAKGASTVSTDYWEAEVEVTSGGPTLSTNHYSNTSPTLGDGTNGGSVGVVPYKMHREDSVQRSTLGTLPANSSTNPIIMSADDFVDGFDLTFYGPIKLRNSAYNALQILHMSTYEGHTSVADLTCRTNQTIAPSDIAGSRKLRTIRIKSDPATPLSIGLYKLTSSPQTSGIAYYCDLDDPAPT